MELLLKEGDHSPPSSSSRPKKEISHIAATAESLQPKGYTLATTKVSLTHVQTLFLSPELKRHQSQPLRPCANLTGFKCKINIL